MTITLSLSAARELAARVLRANGVADDTAVTVAGALVAADADGIATHGLSRLPVYVEQVRRKKIDGMAVPILAQTGPGTLRVDAHDGFAFPAIAMGVARAVEIVATAGIIGLSIANSQHSGVAGHHVEALAGKGLVALMFGNTPAAIAAWGGRKAIYGTNPMAFACPCAGRAPLVIDLSVAKVARGKIVAAARKGEAIPADWALDADGKPTTDAKTALRGTQRPMEDAKGAALALMMEVLGAGLAGSNFGYQAGPLSSEGPPMRVGQFFVVIDPGRFAGDGFAARIATFAGVILGEGGTRLPGDRRLAARQRAAANGISISDELHAELTTMAGRTSAP
jgi:(2R)-3-sulfolactate dehydrogenase (NADP+)